MQHYGIARPSYSAALEPGSFRAHSQLEIANYISQTTDHRRLLRIDGETWIWTNSVQFPIGDGRLLSIQLPIVKHGEGIADQFIYDFHDILQLPQNGRTEDRNDEIFWLLRTNDEIVYFEDNPNSGIGDLRLTLSFENSLFGAEQWHAHIELPSGNIEEQTGNEKFDAGVSFIAYNPDWLNQRKWLTDYSISFWYGLGASYHGHKSYLDEFNPLPFSMSGRAGFAWKITNRLEFKAQLDTQTPLFENDLRELGWMPIQATLGGAFWFNPTTEFNFLLVEDLRPRTTPDAVFSFGISKTF